MSTLKNIYKVTKEQYRALLNGETITINGVDYTYKNTALYLVEDNEMKGIASIEKTSTAGLEDTYTITYTDATTSTFTVTNGADGADALPPLEAKYISTDYDTLPIANEDTDTIARRITSKFNRTPVLGDVFTLYGKLTDGNTTFVAICEFTAHDTNRGTWTYTYLQVIDTTGASGTSGEDGTVFYTKYIDDACPSSLSEIVDNDYVITKLTEQRIPQVGDFVIEIYSTPNSRGQSVIVEQLTSVQSPTVASDNATVIIASCDHIDRYFADGKTGEQGIQGIQGETGNGITSIHKTSSQGLVDTHTITFTDGTATTFTVTNGKDGEQGLQGVAGKNGNSICDVGITLDLADQPQVGEEVTINYGGCEVGDFVICRVTDSDNDLPLRTLLVQLTEKDAVVPNQYKGVVSAIVGGEKILFCSTEFAFTSEPVSGYSNSGLSVSTFDTKPNVGDTFLMSGMWGGQNYLCACRVKDLFAGETLANFVVLSATAISGLSALECSYTYETTVPPSIKIGSQISFDGSQQFNRTPVNGDFFQMIWEETNTGVKYGVLAKFAWQGGTTATFYPQEWWTLGTKGVDGVDGSEYYDINLDYACPEDLPTEGTTKYTYVKRYTSQREPKAGDLFCFNYTGVNSKGQSKIINVITRTGSIANGTITTGFKPLYFVEGEKGASALYNHRIGLYLGFSLIGDKQYAYFNIKTPDSEPYTSSNLSSKMLSYGYLLWQPSFWYNSYSTSTSVQSGAKYWLVTGVTVGSSTYSIRGLDCTNSTPTIPKNNSGGMTYLARFEWANGGEMTDTVTLLQ